MWTAPVFGDNPPSCWYVLVLAAAGLPHRSTEFSHWVRDAISLVYEVRGLSSPLSVRAHSTRSVASSQALFQRGSPRIYLCSGRMVISAHFYQVL